MFSSTEAGHLNYRNSVYFGDCLFAVCILTVSFPLPTMLLCTESHTFSNYQMLHLHVPVCIYLYTVLNHFFSLQEEVLGEGAVPRSRCKTKLSWEREEKINTKIKLAKELVNTISQCWLILSPSYLSYRCRIDT